VRMKPIPVLLQVVAPSAGTLFVDGKAVEKGHAVETNAATRQYDVQVLPGVHKLRLEIEHHEANEQTVKAAVGSETVPILLELRAHRRSRPVELIPTRTERRPPHRTARWLAVAAAGLGVVAGGLSVRAFLKKQDYEDRLKDFQNEPTEENRQRAA